ncbi:hypothetical protein ABPG72_016079 [Tetrahymena utriculariae]
MGACGTKSKIPKNAKKKNQDKYQEKETNDNNPADLEDYVIPQDLEQKIEFLCSQKFNKHLRMRSVDTNFFYKVIVESNITNNPELEKAIINVREKIKQKNEQITRNVDNKGSTCIQVISEYHSKIKDFDFKGLLAMMLQDKCTDNQIPPLIEKVLTISIKCYQIVLSILLCTDYESIEKWWNINKDNQNITEEFFAEILDIHKQLSLKNEQHQQVISILASRRVTKDLIIFNEDNKKNISSNSIKPNSNPNVEDQNLKDMANQYLNQLYGGVQSNNTSQPILKNENLQEIKSYVKSYLNNLYSQSYKQLESVENINDLELENDHKALDCINYSFIPQNVQKKQMYMLRKD